MRDLSQTWADLPATVAVMNADEAGTEPVDTANGQRTRLEIPGRLTALARRILKPLARLFVAHGGNYNSAEKILREAFLDAGREELLRAGVDPNMSRLSLSTGLHRKEVRRLMAARESDQQFTGSSVVGEGRSMASELYMLWSTGERYSDQDGPKDLPLRAADNQPSFASLARTVSRDAHPRSLLEELRRLGLVEETKANGFIRLRRGGFVPLQEQAKLLELLSENVADHFDTAASNVVDGGDKLLEQSVWLEGLSYQSIQKIDALSRDIWAKATNTLVAAMVQHGTSDATGSEEKTRYRVRVGMFTYSDAPRYEKDRSK